ncbi:HK97 gp10 family phage protein [Cetobacterium somerae]|uniref:HK97 gp10 family phage protein n=1 Tax=Cetobacterium somerae TaxID=188913 RepID=UPI00225AC34E|nr:HK97 gp10 family phage protein [Cetobacterium somerae]MCX3068428.1 HK97 gp10 family phage protein [Cetobacterium somerae]
MSLNQLSKDLLKLANSINNGKDAKEFLRKSGNKLKNKTLNIAKVRVNENTGNYLKSIKRGKVYDFKGDLAVRTYSTAPHAHLIEYGHIKKDRTGKEHGFQRGKHIFTTAAKDFEDEFYKDTEKFIDDVLMKTGFK